jgi:hypothetical protein
LHLSVYDDAHYLYDNYVGHLAAFGKKALLSSSNPAANKDPAADIFQGRQINDLVTCTLVIG